MDCPENINKKMHNGSCPTKVSPNDQSNLKLPDSPKFKWGDLDDEDLKGYEHKALQSYVSTTKYSSLGSVLHDKVNDSVSCAENPERSLQAIKVKEKLIASIDDKQAAHNGNQLLEKGTPKVIEQLEDDNVGDTVHAKLDSATHGVIQNIALASREERIFEIAAQPGEADVLAEESKDESVIPVETTKIQLKSVPFHSSQGATEEDPRKLPIEQEIHSVMSGIERSVDLDWNPSQRLAEHAHANVDTAQKVEKSREEDSMATSLAEDTLTDMLNTDTLAPNKERFRQRLWCYLFENLNRAIDELYFLCELDSDMDQIREALLVLDEAAVDFKDLKARIKGFNKLRNSVDATQTSHSAKGGSKISTQLEHHRPHAIAWEVRRMASSPRKADILSSSLEAFKKAQQESSKHDRFQQAKQRYLSYAQDSKENLPGKVTKEKEAVTAKDVAGRTRVKLPSSTSSIELMRRGSSSEKVESVAEGSKDLPSAGKLQGSHASSALQDLPKIREARKAEGKSRVHNSSTDQNRGLVDPIDATRAQRVLSSSASQNDKSLRPSTYGPELASVGNKDKERKLSSTRTAMEAWKEKRNWEDILSSPLSSRVSRSPMTGRKSTERARVLHDKLMSPERKKKTPLAMKKVVDEKQARATRIRRELETERAQRLQRTAEKLNRVSEWQAVRSSKLREGMYARQLRVESRHEAHLAEVARRASDESSKVSEVRFITSLNDENKKLSLQQKLQDSELRRAERLQTIKVRQKEDMAREEAALERRKLLETERLQRIAEAQRKNDEAQARRDEERRAASLAREARAVEQVRKKEVRAKAQQEEAELSRQRLAERLKESALRRNVYLEQIRERALMENRDQGSPLSRRPSTREMPVKALSGQSIDYEFPSEKESSVKVSTAVKPSSGSNTMTSTLISGSSSIPSQLSKKRIKRVRQRLTAQKFEYVEPPVGLDAGGIGPASVTGAAKSKIGRWMQDVQRFQQAKRAGSSAAGLVIGEMVKYLEGKVGELHAARQAGLLDFVATAIQASHTSNPGASQFTISMVCLLNILLLLPANRSYFLARNLLPPLIPILATALENFSSVGLVSVTASSIGALKEGSVEKSVVDEKLEAVREVFEGLLKCVTSVLDHACYEHRQAQMQDDLAELVVACEIVHRIQNLFSLFDRPLIEGAPIPSSVILGLRLLETLTGPRRKLLATMHEAPVNIPADFRQLQNAIFKNVTETYDIPSLAHGCEDESSQSAVLIGFLPEGQLEKVSDENIQVIEKGKEVSIEVSNYKGSLGTVESHEKGENYERKMEAGFPGDMGAADDSSKVADKDLRLQNVGRCIKDETCELQLKKSVGFLLSTIAETGLVGLPSLLTAVLLQANPRASPEQAACSLPSNFEEVATSVLRVLNNIARLNLQLVQNMLEMPDLRMEFFHLVSFLLSYCTCKWRSASDQVALLLLETLLLLGYFGLLHAGNQAVLRWGKTPTILQKVCDLPFAFFTDPQLTPILAGTILATCYGSDRNRDVICQELSMEMLLSFLKCLRDEVVTIETKQSALLLDSLHKPHAKQLFKPGATTKTGPGDSGDNGGMADNKKTSDKIFEDGPNEETSTEELVLSSESVPKFAGNNSTAIKGQVAEQPKKTAKTASKRTQGDGDPPSKDIGFVKSNSHHHGNSGKGNGENIVQSKKAKITSLTGSDNSGKSSKVSNAVPNQPLPLNSSNPFARSDGCGIIECTDSFSFPPAFMLRNRFPENLWDAAEEFFTTEQ